MGTTGAHLDAAMMATVSPLNGQDKAKKKEIIQRLPPSSNLHHATIIRVAPQFRRMSISKL